MCLQSTITSSFESVATYLSMQGLDLMSEVDYECDVEEGEEEVAGAAEESSVGRGRGLGCPAMSAAGCSCEQEEEAALCKRHFRPASCQ